MNHNRHACPHEPQLFGSVPVSVSQPSVSLFELQSLVPLAQAPITSLGILMSIWTWNQFLLALVLVEDPTKRTMAGALGAFQGHYATDVPLLCAGTILILVPTLIVFVLFQRQIIMALLQGAVKG